MGFAHDKCEAPEEDPAALEAAWSEGRRGRRA